MFILQKNFQSVDLENAANSCLANLPGVEQVELLRSLVEIVAERNAISPLLALSRFGPELNDDWVAGAQLDAPQVWRKTEINDIEVETTNLPFDAFGIDRLKRFGNRGRTLHTACHIQKLFSGSSGS